MSDDVQASSDSPRHRHGTQESNFSCNICFEEAREPVTTVCGHLFCWPCLYRWMRSSSNRNQECPVCKAGISREKVIPIFGRGRIADLDHPPDSDPLEAHESEIPERPRGERPRPEPNPNYRPNTNLPFNVNDFIGGGGARQGGFSFQFGPFNGFHFGWGGGRGGGGGDQRAATPAERRSLFYRAVFVFVGLLLLFFLLR